MGYIPGRTPEATEKVLENKAGKNNPDGFWLTVPSPSSWLVSVNSDFA